MIGVRQQERGAALLVALFVIIFTMTAGMLLAAGLQLRMELVRQQARDLQLDALLDAGMARGLAELDRSRSYLGTRGPVALGSGSYEVVTRQQGNQLEMFVAARLGAYRRQVEAKLTLFPLQVVAWRRVAFEPELWQP